jgi:hypothetical protein
VVLFLCIASHFRSDVGIVIRPQEQYRDSVVGTVTSSGLLRSRNCGSISGSGGRFFFFSKTYRPALETPPLRPMPPVQWIPVSFAGGKAAGE